MTRYSRVNKTKARRLYNEGKTLYLVPNKCRFDFDGFWIPPYKINKIESFEWQGVTKDFDKLINSFEYYNCNNELGTYTHFYIEEN